MDSNGNNDSIWLIELANMEINGLSDKVLIKLLKTEKERRNIDSSKQLFIGMADVADYWWCAMRSILKNIDMELGFFISYLHDRIIYSYSLGYYNESLPHKKDKWITIGDNITKDDIEQLLHNTKSRNDNEVIEHYPTIRWNFPINNYIIVGVPDGITGKFVYECKRTASRFLLSYAKPGAMAQADLYGYFFQRLEKRVQINIREEHKTETWQIPIDNISTLDLINKFNTNYNNYLNGVYPQEPRLWKHKSCEYYDMCPIINKPHKLFTLGD